MPPPRMSTSTLASRLSRTLSLPDTFAPPTIAANGLAGILEQAREHRDLALHQEARVGRQELGDADRARMGAVRGPERVVHVDLGVVRELAGERRVVLLLLGVEAEVLEEEELAVAQPLHGVDRADAERVAGDRHVAAEELRQALGDRPQAEAVLDLAIGPAEVAREDHPRPVGQEVVDRRDRGTDARIVGDLAVLQRDVEVDANEDALPGDVDVADVSLSMGRSGCSRPPPSGGAGGASRELRGDEASRSAQRQL